MQGTQADFKNELLFKRFSINYSTLPAIFRKGTCIYRKEVRVFNRRAPFRREDDVLVPTFVFLTNVLSRPEYLDSNTVPRNDSVCEHHRVADFESDVWRASLQSDLV